MHLQFKLCQHRHDKEVAMEVGECFLQYAYSEFWVLIRLQQMSAHQCLVQIRRYLRDQKCIPGIHHRLVLESEIGMHRMAKFMGERAQAEYRIVVKHHNEW